MSVRMQAADAFEQKKIAVVAGGDVRKDGIEDEDAVRRRTSGLVSA